MYEIPELLGNLGTILGLVSVICLPFVLVLYIEILLEEKKEYEEKKVIEKKLEVIKDTERIVEIEWEFKKLDSELQTIRGKYQKRLFSFLKK